LVEATARGSDAVVASSEKIVHPLSPVRGHGVEVSVVVGASMHPASQAGEDAVEAPTADTMATRPLEIIDLDDLTSRTTIGKSSRLCWSAC
jgi:hypothetical protein